MRELGYRPYQVGLTEADEMILYRVRQVEEAARLESAVKLKPFPVIVLASRGSYG